MHIVSSSLDGQVILLLSTVAVKAAVFSFPILHPPTPMNPSQTLMFLKTLLLIRVLNEGLVVLILRCYFGKKRVLLSPAAWGGSGGLPGHPSFPRLW